MNIRKRAEVFALYVGLELKGKIASRGYTAKSVAEAIGRQPAAFNRWLNGKVELPLTVLCEACEYIDVDPTAVVEDAYSRLAVEQGERDGQVYLEDGMAGGGEVVVGVPDVGAPAEDDHVVDLTQEAFDLAASTDDSAVDPNRLA